ncbi:MAG: MipA/OmpV family protein [Hyphomicrobiales bacterium]|nr:MipA/OmpV family protein [Hyphomicrobiales bacterium]
MGDGLEYLLSPNEFARLRGVGPFGARRIGHLVCAGMASALSMLPLAASIDAALSADFGQPQAGVPASVPTPLDSGWIATLKVTTDLLPDWEGAKSYSFLAYPSVSLRRADARDWSAPDDGLDFSIYDASGFSIGPVARYELGRYRSDDPRALFGIHDVPWSIEAGGFAEFWPIPNTFRARIEIRHGIAAGNGFVADAAADYLLHFGPATFALGPRLSLGDRDFMRTQFGVTLTDSLQNGAVTPFKPDGGLKSAGVATSVTYEFSKEWSAVVDGGYDRLVADAAKSPLVKKLGSPDQFRVGLTVNYSFGLSGL